MSTDDVTGQLRMLTELHEAGAISDDELGLARARLLGGDPGVPSGATAVERVAVTATGPRPAPIIPPPVVRGRPAGDLVILGGALLVLLAFAALPLATSSFFGSITAPGLAVEASRSGQAGIAGLLWLVLPLALAMAGIGAWQRWGSGVGSGPRRTGAITVLVLAGVVVLVYTIMIGSLGGNAIGVSFTGAGLFLALIGAAASALGAGMILSTAGDAARSGASLTAVPPAGTSMTERLGRPVLIGGYEMPLGVPVLAGVFVGVVLLLVLLSTAV